MVRTLAGRDHQARTMGDGTAPGVGTGDMAPADYIGLSADNTAEDDTRTALPGEIVAGTLVRAQAAYAHTNGQATFTLTKTFTSDQAVTLRKMGVMLADGTMTFEKLFSADAPLVSGDQIAVTATITL